MRSRGAGRNVRIMPSPRPTPLRLIPVLIAFLFLPLLAVAADEPDPIVKGQKVEGVYHGKVEIWATPTIKKAAGRYLHGEPDGKWTFWDESGTKIAEVNYHSGTFSGAVILWYNTASGPRARGKVKLRGSFLDGMWEGSILTYFPAGRTRSERVYQEGIVTAAYAYNENGQRFTEADARRIAAEDEAADNAMVDAIDEYIRQWAG